MAEHRKARESAEAAIELARRIGFERGEGVSLCHAANADLALGDRDRARGRLTQATALFEAGGNRELESIALATLAQVDLSTGNLQQALAYSSRAVAIAESIRGSVIDPELRASFRAYRGNHYGLQVDILMSLHQQTPSGGFDIQAMEASERSRARSLIEMLAESLFRGSDSHYATAQYSTALGQERIQREILDRDTALIEFALGEQKSYVWVVTPNGSVSAVLPPRKQIEQRVEAYRKELAQGSSALTVRTALVRLDALGAQLYRDLLAPVETAFGTAGRLIIVPDGMLAYLPFETLGGDRRLIERFAISYSPSASALATLRNRLKESVPPPKALLAFGDALYAPPGVGRQSERGLGFTQLPHTRTEVTAIRSLFPAGGSRVYLGAEARKDTVQAEQLDQYRFVHFAVHGRYDEEHPARSGIALSQSAESRQDGILQVPEIMRLRLRAEMVALSACQTGLGKLLAGEGVMGMSRAFLYAGADSVLTSLWNVNDASTAELMKLVYRNLTRGLPRDEALRAAKLQLMRGPQSTWRHPYHWAPFVLLGDAAQR
jgi:CHAT domain-containing protein